jgi:PHD/YefM family antitoxin component YafN of YafNO toxin-antitoxin module
MNKTVQIIVTPSGERLVVLPEEDYLLLLAASEDEEGEPTPEFLEELHRRRQKIADEGTLVAFDTVRGKSA